MIYSVIHMFSDSGAAIDSVVWILRRQYDRVTDAYNSALCDHDFNWCFDEIYEGLEKKNLLTETQKRYFFNLPTDFHILDLNRINENEVRFSFVMDEDHPEQMLAFLTRRTLFDVSSISIGYDEFNNKVFRGGYLDGKYRKNRLVINEKRKPLKLHQGRNRVEGERQGLLVDPRTWFGGEIYLPIYKGLTILHQWLKDQSVEVKTNSVENERSNAVWSHHCDGLSNDRISGYTSIPVGDVDQILSRLKVQTEASTTKRFNAPN